MGAQVRRASRQSVRQRCWTVPPSGHAKVRGPLPIARAVFGHETPPYGSDAMRLGMRSRLVMDASLDASVRQE